MNIHHYFEGVDYTRRGFHVAAFNTPTYEEAHELRIWCFESFGAAGYRVNTNEIRWKDDITWGEIRFQRKEDFEWFMLRWA